MKKKVILLTGAAGFLGSKLINELAVNNKVIAIDFDKKKMSKLKKNSKKYENNIDYFICDITKIQNILRIKKFVKKKGYSVDIIINNAALNPPIKLGRTFKLAAQSKILEDFNVSIIGSYLIIREFLPDMIYSKSGKIINIGSDLSTLSPDHEIYIYKKMKSLKSISYPIVKHGLVGLTKYFATLNASKNISCNMISPGPIDNNQPKFLKRRLKKKNPTKKLAPVSDIIEVINMLAKLKTNYLNGQNIIVDGGQSLV